MKVYKFEVFLPEEYIEAVLDKAAQLGACRVGDYEHVASYYEVKGSWKPNENSKPVNGVKNEINYGSEYKLEFRCPEDKVREVLQSIRKVHPYEEALINVIRLDNDLFE